jgi:hypothetical protein
MNALMLILSLGLILFHHPVAEEGDCQPEPDYWFLETYHAETGALPESISIHTSPPHVERGYFQLKNHADVPVYVLPLDAAESVTVTETPSLGAELSDEGNPPEEQILLEKVPNLAVYVVEAGESLRLDIDTLPNLVPYIEDRNILDVDRPGFVRLPMAQRGAFHLVQGERFFSVPFAISYALNQNFSPVNCEASEAEHRAEEIAPVEQPPATDTIISTVAFVILTLLVALALLLLRQQRGKSVG